MQLTLDIPDDAAALVVVYKPVAKTRPSKPPDARVIDTTAEAIDDDNVVRLADWKAA